MAQLLFIILVLLSAHTTLAQPMAGSSNKINHPDCVILLHGLGRTHRAMAQLESMLQHQHYQVVNQDYPSTKKPIAELAEESIPNMIAACSHYPLKHIHFVTHSLGGIVLQTYLHTHSLHNIGYIVMLGPPNHGSPIADMLHNQWIFKQILGPAAQELTTQRTPMTLRQHHLKIGVIAGNHSLLPFTHFLFHERNDGKVGISSTHMHAMTDFITLPVSHIFMLKNPLVAEQISYFLQHGRFIHRLS